MNHSEQQFLGGFTAQIASIEALADKILADVGIRFEGDPDTCALWHANGARVDDDRVYLDGFALREIIRKNAPQEITLLAPDPVHSHKIGQDYPPVLVPCYGPPNVLLRDGQRTAGSRALYRELVSMADASDAIRNTGHMLCVMNDVVEENRPMEMLQAHLDLSAKSFMGTVASADAAQAVIAQARASISGGDPGSGACHLLHLINATPPLTYKCNPLACLREVACAGEGAIVTSYMMLGATGPVTLAGALAQGYAECLSGLALAQLWRPGTPVVMGLFATQFSMSAMQPWFGDPLSQQVQIYSVALARHLGVPVRGDGGFTSSFLDDAQAGYEGGRATATALMAGADFILHSAGWLESGRTVSLAKFDRESDALSGRRAERNGIPS